MYQPQRKKQPSLLNLFGTMIVFVAVVGFTMMSLTTGDPLWFWPVFDAQPEQITIYCYGEGIVLQPGTEVFTELTALLNDNLSGSKNWDSLSMSLDTWNDYQTRQDMMTLVTHYPEKVRIHSTYKFFSGVDTLIVPLDGRHAQSNAIFGLTDEVPSSGSLHVESNANLSEYILNKKVCSQSVALSD